MTIVKSNIKFKKNGSQHDKNSTEPKGIVK